MSKSKPKFKIGDTIVVKDWQTFGDSSYEYEMKITEISQNHGGPGNHRYWGTRPGRGDWGVYEDQIDRKKIGSRPQR